ncbi:MAG: DUF2066 domain-containing protein [Gammaproteobacteria bacterium]|nr:MAG: DUF2066 domain-containing protein [Gammaproteobacteria bacterium]
MARILVLAFSLLMTNAWAQTYTDNYRVEALVTNQSESERVAAAKANLGEVIRRVLGDSAALQHPLVREAINDAPNYLSKFSYSSDNTLVLNYSPQAIQTLLQKAQLIAANASTAQGLTVYVVDVQDFTAFKQVQLYLKTVGVIRSVNLVSVDKDVLQFNVLLDGDEQLLKTSLAAGNRLQFVDGDAQYPLSFRWQN